MEDGALVKYRSFEEAFFETVKLAFKEAQPSNKERMWIPGLVLELKSGFYEKQKDGYVEVAYGRLNKRSDPQNPEVIAKNAVVLYEENHLSGNVNYTFVTFNVSEDTGEILYSLKFINPGKQQELSYKFPIGVGVLDYSTLKNLASTFVEGNFSLEYLKI